MQRARTALIAAVAHGAATPRVGLRNAIAAYLSARNYAPLASGYLGVAQAIGGGERAALRVLRRYESASAAATADQLRDALWVLLDKRTLGFALGAADATTLPGVRLDDRATRRATAAATRRCPSEPLREPSAGHDHPDLAVTWP